MQRVHIYLLNSICFFNGFDEKSDKIYLEAKQWLVYQNRTIALEFLKVQTEMTDILFVSPPKCYLCKYRFYYSRVEQCVNFRKKSYAE